MESWKEELYANSLMHYGIKGMKWGLDKKKHFDHEFGSYKTRTVTRRNSSGGMSIYREEYKNERRKKYNDKMARERRRINRANRIANIKNRINKLFGIKL